MGGIITSFATNVVLLYAGLMSFRALQSKGSDDDKQWLTFWLLFSLLEFVTTFTDWLGWIIPFYGFIKLGLVIVLGFLNGARLLYPLLEPLLLKAEKVAQKYETQAKGKFGPSAAEAMERMKKATADGVNKLKESMKDK